MIYSSLILKHFVLHNIRNPCSPPAQQTKLLTHFMEIKFLYCHFSFDFSFTDTYHF